MTRLFALAATTGLALALLAAAGGAAAQTSFAAQSSVSTISPCPSFCGGPGSLFGSDSDGGEGFTSSQSAFSNIDGNGRAEVTLTGMVGLPILKAQAFASPLRSSLVEATATGMQGFHVGLGGLSSYELGLTLTGQATGNVRADLLVYRDREPFSLPSFSSDLGSMQFEVIELSGDLELVGSPTLSLPANDTQQSRSGSVLIEDLNVGDVFYVWARLSATGRNGTYGDALNTLTLAYADPTGLSQLAPVPEPGAWMMFVAGFAALAWRKAQMSTRLRVRSRAIQPTIATMPSSTGKPSVGDHCSSAPDAAEAAMLPKVYDSTSTAVLLTRVMPSSREPMSIIARV